MAVQLGKRYGADYMDTGTKNAAGEPIMTPRVEVLVIKPGNCIPVYNGETMQIITPQVLPSAD